MCSEASFMSPLTNDSWALVMLLSGSTSGAPVACAWAVVSPPISTTTTHTLQTEDHLLIICVPPASWACPPSVRELLPTDPNVPPVLGRHCKCLTGLVGEGRRLSRECPDHETELFGNYYYTDGPRADAGRRPGRDRGRG